MLGNTMFYFIAYIKQEKKFPNHQLQMRTPKSKNFNSK